MIFNIVKVVSEQGTVLQNALARLGALVRKYGDVFTTEAHAPPWRGLAPQGGASAPEGGHRAILLFSFAGRPWPSRLGQATPNEKQRVGWAVPTRPLNLCRFSASKLCFPRGIMECWNDGILGREKGGV
jgi:hypothetical protein